MTLKINCELLPGLTTNLYGAPSSCLYLFLEISEYFAKASFLFCKNFYWSSIASSNGLCILRGGKYLGGNFLTSKILLIVLSLISFKNYSFSLSRSDWILSFSSSVLVNYLCDCFLWCDWCVCALGLGPSRVTRCIRLLPWEELDDTLSSIMRSFYLFFLKMPL